MEKIKVDEVGTSDLVHVLKKPYKFEEKEYTQIDLTRFEDMSGDDLSKIQKKYNQLNGVDGNTGNVLLPESDLSYVMFASAEATGLPLEFFKRLPARELRSIQAIIIGFFLG